MCPFEVQGVHLCNDNIHNELHLITRCNPVDLMTQLSPFSTWLLGNTAKAVHNPIKSGRSLWILNVGGLNHGARFQANPFLIWRQPGCHPGDAFF